MGNAVAWDGFPVSHWKKCVLLKPPQRTAQILLDEFTTCPRAAKLFARLAGHTRTGKRIEHEVSGVGEHPHKILGQIHGEPRRMHFDSALRAVANVCAVALSVRDGDEVRWNRSTVVRVELLTDIMPGRTQLRFITNLEEGL